MLVSWLAFPLLLGALSLGCGLLLEAVCRTRLAGPLLAPAGLCLVIVVGELLTVLDATAELTAPTVVALGAAGLALSPLSRLRQLDGWALGATVGAFTVFAAPVVASGEATLAGYARLDDTTYWLAMSDFIMHRGRDLSGLPQSDYEGLLRAYLEGGYPVGSFLPLGIGDVLLGSELAWLFQPSAAFFAAMMTLALYSVVSQLVPSRSLSALIAFLASQPALLFGYYLLGGIKEAAAAFALATLSALLVSGIERRGGWATLVPAAVACAATLSILSLGGAVWLVAPLFAALVIVISSRDMTSALRHAGIFSAFAIGLSIPTLLETSDFFSAAGRRTLSSGSELGILTGPLNPLQVLGVWPTDDFRLDPDALGVTYILLTVLVAAAVAGLAFAWLRRAWAPLLFFAGAAVGCLASAAYGSPWVDAKAFAIASPAFVLFGLLGATAVAGVGLHALAGFPRGRVIGAMAIGAAIAGGVLWSNVLAYRGANFAPRDRLSELEKIGEQVAGHGPTLVTEQELYGFRYFLRGGEPEGVWGDYSRPVFLRTGRTLPSLIVRGGTLLRSFADIDRFRVQNILVFRTLVLRRSPVASRPPAPYRLVSRGRFYEVWRRPQTLTRPTIAHLPLGNSRDPAARPPCRAVRRLARRAGSGGVLATVHRQEVIVTTPELVPTDAITRSSSFSAPAPGRYEVWTGGRGFRREVEVSIDGKTVDSDRHRLNAPDQYQPMGAVRLTRGRHRLTLRYGDSDLHPGSIGAPRTLGPVILSRGTAPQEVSLVRPAEVGSLCGQRLDWVEALGA